MLVNEDFNQSLTSWPSTNKFKRAFKLIYLLDEWKAASHSLWTHIITQHILYVCLIMGSKVCKTPLNFLMFEITVPYTNIMKTLTFLGKKYLREVVRLLGLIVVK